MAIIKCAECDYSVSEHAAACMRCGYPISSNHPANIDYRPYINAVVGAISSANQSSANQPMAGQPSGSFAAPHPQPPAVGYQSPEPDANAVWGSQ